MISNKKLAAIRSDYSLSALDEKHLDANPFMQFKVWFNQAVEAKVNEPNAMVLATVKSNGYPTARVVLLKAIEENGFVFYTNYNSHKGKQLISNPFASLVFFWPELQRQVRVEGTVKKVSETESDAYFSTRPLASQIAAHASAQSTTLNSRKEIEQEVEKYKELFSQEPMIRPVHWGGFIVVPSSLEFWQGRESRLHDRIK